MPKTPKMPEPEELFCATCQEEAEVRVTAGIHKLVVCKTDPKHVADQRLFDEIEEAKNFNPLLPPKPE